MNEVWLDSLWCELQVSQTGLMVLPVACVGKGRGCTVQDFFLFQSGIQLYGFESALAARRLGLLTVLVELA